MLAACDDYFRKLWIARPMKSDKSESGEPLAGLNLASPHHRTRCGSVSKDLTDPSTRSLPFLQ